MLRALAPLPPIPLTGCKPISTSGHRPDTGKIAYGIYNIVNCHSARYRDGPAPPPEEVRAGTPQRFSQTASGLGKALFHGIFNGLEQIIGH